MTRLDEYDKDEWRDVSRRLKPEWTEADHEKAWADFQREKARRAAQ